MKFAFRSLLRPVMLSSLLLGLCAIASAQDVPQPTNPQADNTKVNERDRSANEPTADQQKENRTDRDITQQIRKAIVGDKSLSTYAHNVKIITHGGMVTLKGPVRSEEEKNAVEGGQLRWQGRARLLVSWKSKPQQ